jgi:hypothetical protein
MKKLLLFLAIVGLLFGCATGSDQQIVKMQQDIAQLQKQMKVALIGGAGAAFRPFHGLTGDAAGDLDHVDGSTLALGDVAFVELNGDATYGNSSWEYVYHDFGGAVSSNPPYEIKPASSPNANYAWVYAGGSLAPPLYITSTPHTLTLGEARAGLAIIQTNATTVNMPAAASVGFGTMWCAVSDVAEIQTIDPNGSEKMVVNGSVSAAGVAVTSDGALGDYACFVAVTDTDGSGTDGWWMLGNGLTPWQ